MKKILGLDLGTNSIGWALINEPEAEFEQYSIAGIGVRIVPLSSDENDEFTKGNAISKNANRTIKRGTRRNLHRYKLRKQQLTAVFKSLNMFPSDGLDPNEIDFYNPVNYGLISKHLYRVQKMSKKSSGAIDIWFRHHLETKLDDTANAKEIKKFLNITSLQSMTGIKIKINNLGRIVKVGENNANADTPETLIA